MSTVAAMDVLSGIYNLQCYREDRSAIIPIRHVNFGNWATTSFDSGDGRRVDLFAIARSQTFGADYLEVDFKIGEDRVNYMKLSLSADAPYEPSHIDG